MMNKKLAACANEKLALAPGDKCYLYPTLTIAESALSFLASREPSIAAYHKSWTISRHPTHNGTVDEPDDTVTIFAVFTDNNIGFKTQKQYWQHTGDGISSRLAEHCLTLLSAVDDHGGASIISHAPVSSPQRGGNTLRGFSRNKHYSKKSSAALEAIMWAPSNSSTSADPSTSTIAPFTSQNDDKYTDGTAAANGEDTSTYIEERYARNLSASQAPLAKLALRRRVAGVLKESYASSSNTNGTSVPPPPSASASFTASHDLISSASTLAADPPNTLQPSTRGVNGLSEDDVFLYPGGMSAIFHAFMTILKVKEMDFAKKGGKHRRMPVLGKSVCFG